jgi:tetratricopeptide (TPR) repeat protein
MSGTRRNVLSGRVPAVGIFAATLVAYAPVYRAGFIWDDDAHVTRPDLRDWSGLGRIWSSLTSTQQYYPVLHSAFWMEHRLWGDAAVGYHLLNVLLHALAACLFAQVLLRLYALGSDSTGALTASGSAGGVGRAEAGSERRSGTAAVVPAHAAPTNPRWSRVHGAAWLAAALFALHPVAVESVAWISEQKNTLSTVFYLAAALAYLGFDRNRTVGAYFAGLILFALAVLTKSVTVTLPATLLVALWWRRGALGWRRDVAPLLPWFALAVGAGLTTAWVERTYVGASGLAFDLSWAERVVLAGRVAWFYLGKLLWPHPLMFIYPRWTAAELGGGYWLFPLAVLAVLGTLAWDRRRGRGRLAAALCFVGALFPALGFFNVYPFVFSYVADHFSYLAALPLLALAAAAAVAGGEKVAAGASRRAGPPAPARGGVAIALALAVLGLGALTFRQAGTYRDLESLYGTTLALNPDAWLAHDNLGVVLARSGRLTEAIAHYREALRLNPNYAQTQNNLGDAWAQLRQWDEADAAYAAALRLRPDFAQAELNWGNALSDRGAYGEAIGHYERALRIQPESAEAEYRLGSALANTGRLADAADHFAAALRRRPDYAEAEANLGLALALAHRTAEAWPHFARAVTLNSGYPEAQLYWGVALAQSGDPAAAIPHYEAALRLNPGSPGAHYQLAVALRATGRLEEAAAEFTAANRLARPGAR